MPHCGARQGEHSCLHSSLAFQQDTLTPTIPKAPCVRGGILTERQGQKPPPPPGLHGPRQPSPSLPVPSAGRKAMSFLSEGILSGRKGKPEKPRAKESAMKGNSRPTSLPSPARRDATPTTETRHGGSQVQAARQDSHQIKKIKDL